MSEPDEIARAEIAHICEIFDREKRLLLEKLSDIEGAAIDPVNIAAELAVLKGFVFTLLQRSGSIGAAQ